MTFPCKEEYIAFEQLERRQHRIYPDACDHGILVSEIANIGEIRQNLNELIAMHKADRSYFAITWGNGKSVEMFIPFEIDDGVERGVILSVVKTMVRTGDFLSISITRFSRPYTPTKKASEMRAREVMAGRVASNWRIQQRLPRLTNLAKSMGLVMSTSD